MSGYFRGRLKPARRERLEAINFGLGAAGNDTRIGPRNARFGPKQATGVGAADLIGSRTSGGLGKPLGGPRGPGRPLKGPQKS